MCWGHREREREREKTRMRYSGRGGETNAGGKEREGWLLLFAVSFGTVVNMHF